jgi:hypothetical protein
MVARQNEFFESGGRTTGCNQFGRPGLNDVQVGRTGEPDSHANRDGTGG